MVCVLLLCACAAPTRDYDIAQIEKVDDLVLLMHVQATVADPRFELADRLASDEVSASDFAAFLDMGRRLAATSRRLPAFSMGPGFDTFGTDQLSKARALEKYAGSGDGARTLETALSIKKTCAACHAEYR